MAVLDEEHERCEAALARLAELRSGAALRELLCAYEARGDRLGCHYCYHQYQYQHQYQ